MIEKIEIGTTRSSSKNQSNARELTDFEKYALVAKNVPVQADPTTMDGTSNNKISIMANQKY